MTGLPTPKGQHKKAQSWRIAEKARDIQWAKDVKERDTRCMRCGATWPLHAHHIVSRRHKPLRHELSNGVTLCEVCHVWVHANPDRARNMGLMARVSEASQHES